MTLSSRNATAQGWAVVTPAGELFSGCQVFRKQRAAIDQFLQVVAGSPESAGPWARWRARGYRLARVEIRELSDLTTV